MPFYRCMIPSSSSGGDSHCDHITINYNGIESPYPIELNNTPVPMMFENVLGDNNTFNSDVIIGGGLTNANSLLGYCNNFNANVDMSNAFLLNSVSYMFYLCTNFNRPVVFPKHNVYSYFATFRACFNYNQPTELFINTGDNASLRVNLVGTFMQCYNFNAQVKFNFLSNVFLGGCQYTQMFYQANSYNQPTIFKHVGSFDNVFNRAYNMRAPIIIDLQPFNSTNRKLPWNNALTDSQIPEIIVLNYTDQEIRWNGSVANVTYYVNDPNTFVNKCTYFVRTGADKYNYLPCDNGLIADTSYYNIRVLYNVDDACNRFNNLYYERFGEYPEYN